MRKLYVFAALGSVALVTWGCTSGVISEEQATKITEWINEMEKSGGMPADIAAMFKSMVKYSAEGFPWDKVLIAVVSALGLARFLPNSWLLGKDAAKKLSD